MTRQKIDRLITWAANWLEKMSIVAIFNGFFAGSFASFLVGIMCACGSLFFAMKEVEDDE